MKEMLPESVAAAAVLRKLTNHKDRNRARARHANTDGAGPLRMPLERASEAAQTLRDPRNAFSRPAVCEPPAATMRV